MKNYENYLLRFGYLSYIEKTKFGKFTGRYSKDGLLVYEPFTMNEFERKMMLDIGFDTKWNIDV